MCGSPRGRRDEWHAASAGKFRSGRRGQRVPRQYPGSVGFGFARLSRAAACMIIPVWQYPHCETSSWIEAFWQGCVASGDSPSIVAWPSSFRRCSTSTTWQERTGSPFSWTRASPADSHAAAVLGSGQLNQVAQRPEQGHVGIGLNVAGFPVYEKFEGRHKLNSGTESRVGMVSGSRRKLGMKPRKSDMFLRLEPKS